MSDTIDISKKDKASLLAALYNHARPLGLGFLQYVEGDMPPNVAKQIVEDCQRQRDQRPELANRWLDIDYLSGRVMKVNLSGDEMRTDLYNRDNGSGSAEAIVNSLPDIEAES